MNRSACPNVPAIFGSVCLLAYFASREVVSGHGVDVGFRVQMVEGLRAKREEEKKNSKSAHAENNFLLLGIIHCQVRACPNLKTC